MVVEQLREAAESDGAAAAAPASAAPGLDGYIRAAVRQLNKSAATYRRYNAYYDGSQPLTYATESYTEQFARMVAAYCENMCPAVIDALADRLSIQGFESATDTEAVQLAQEAWEHNRMDQRAGEVHQEAAKCGDAYVIVWPDARDEQLITLWPQRADSCTVHYDEDGRIDWGAKWWLEEGGFGRLTLYLPDVIVRLRTQNVVRTGNGMPATSAAFATLAEVPNPHGEVPIFHFANNAAVASFGRSELKDVIPLQDALNKATADMLVGMEFNAYGQRWGTGIQGKLDETGKPVAAFVPGVSRLWTTGAIDARFGEFSAANLPNLIAAQDKFLTSIARVTGTPTHYMLLSPSNFPSGEALKTAEARFVAKILDRQTAYGNAWEDVMRFTLKLMGHEAPEHQHISLIWKDASPRSEREAAEVAGLKALVGVSSEQNLRELGYSDEDIDRMAGEKAESADVDAERAAAAFDSGKPPMGA